MGDARCGGGGTRAPLIGFYMAIGVLALAIAASAGARAGAAVGVQGRSFDGIGTSSSPTTTKPESKLWWHDGQWWASMWDSKRRGNWIFRLNARTQQWLNTGVALDPRARARADVLSDAGRLYVASHVYSKSNVAGRPSWLYRFAYDRSAKRYVPVRGFPVRINNVGTKSLVIAKDSTGRLWATWVFRGRVFVNHTRGRESTWGVPFVLPGAGTRVKGEDLSAAIAFGGDGIGIMWSNQLHDAVYFAVHRDRDPVRRWQPAVTVIEGLREADNHVNLKTDASGRVFAVVKTNLRGADSPLIKLLVRSPSGEWQSHVVARKVWAHTRPILQLNTAHRTIHVFAPAGGVIFEKTSPMDAISFEDGVGEAFIRTPQGSGLSDPTSTKQNLTTATGVVVLASDSRARRYWHNVRPIRAAGPSPP